MYKGFGAAMSGGRTDHNTTQLESSDYACVDIGMFMCAQVCKDGRPVVNDCRGAHHLVEKREHNRDVDSAFLVACKNAVYVHKHVEQCDLEATVHAMKHSLLCLSPTFKARGRGCFSSILGRHIPERFVWRRGGVASTIASTEIAAAAVPAAYEPHHVVIMSIRGTVRRWF